MSTRIRVLHLIQNLNYGGMERLLHDLVLRLDPAAFENHVLALQYLGRFARGLEDHAGLHLAEPQEPWSLLWPRRLSRQIRRLAPDVVHTHSGVWYKASLAARLAGASRLVHTEHGRQRPDPWQARLMDGLASRRTDVVVAVSEPLAEHLAEHLRVDADKITVIPNGVDWTRFSGHDSAGAKRRLGLVAKAPVIGSVGRLEWVKGYDLVIEAFAALLREAPASGEPPQLVVVGDGSERSHLEKRVRELGVSERTHLLGWRDDVQAIYPAFDLFTMGSRSEGTSVSLLEAMSAGLCPVVTNVGGNAYVLGSELRHRLVPAEDVTALADAWRAVLRDSKARRADGERAERRVREVFSLDAMVRSYSALYQA